MSALAKPTSPPDPIVSLMLTGGRVTASFRASLFAAAGRAGTSVNEFVLTATAEKLKADGAPFTGVFAPGDLLSDGAEDPFAGDQSTTAIELHGVFVTKAERTAFERVKPTGRDFGTWAIDLMRETVRRKARKA